MAGSNFNVGVVVNVLGIGAALAAVNALSGRFNSASRAAKAFGNQAKSATALVMELGAAAAGVGLVIAAGLWKANDAAAAVQQSIVNIATSTQTSVGQSMKLWDVWAAHVHDAVMSLQDAGQLFEGMARAGIPKSAIDFFSAQEDAYRAAFLVHQYKGEPYKQIGEEQAGILHQLGLYGYTPQERATDLDIIRRSAILETQNPAMYRQVVMGGTYLFPIFRALKMGPQEIADAYDAMLAAYQASLTGGGGGMGARLGGGLSPMNIRNIIQRSFPGMFGGSTLNNLSIPLLASMGIVDPNTLKSTLFNKSGAFDITRLETDWSKTLEQLQTPAGQRRVSRDQLKFRGATPGASVRHRYPFFLLNPKTTAVSRKPGP